MKILLLTDMPPCRRYTAGLVLERLVRFLPKEEVAICAVINRSLIKEVEIPSDLADIPTLVLQKPVESFPRILPSGLLCVVKFIFELIQGMRVRLQLLPRIARFAREQHIEKIWIILEGQTMIRMARPLSALLKVPLYTQVWDPFEWWLRANRVDRYTQKRLLTEYDEIIRYSASCATASWAMSDAYSKKYGVKNLPVIASLPEEYAPKLLKAVDNGQQFIIGMAGQFYAVDAWEALISALDNANWRVGGKDIFIRVIGGYSKNLTTQPKHFEDLGWKSQEETLSILANTDLLYMPYWFSDEFHLESSNSFPSKLVSYFCVGRPVYCHAPLYASPTKYILNKKAGYICPSLDAEVILKTLEHVILDKGAYQKMGTRGKECFLQDFTLERMRTTFYQFLDIHQSDDTK